MFGPKELDLSTVKLTRGKYKGWRLSAIKDVQYLRWFLQSVDGMDGKLITGLQQRIDQLRRL